MATFTGSNSEVESDLVVAKDFLNRDMPLSPRLISSLTRVGAELKSTAPYEEGKEQKELPSHVLYGVTILAVSVLFAATVGVIFLYAYEVGPFYTIE